MAHATSADIFHFDLTHLLQYPIKIQVESWHSARPLHWMSISEGTIVAEGAFLEPPGLPLLSLQDEAGGSLLDGIPEPVLQVCEIAGSLDYELAQACACSRAAYELAVDTPLLLILLIAACKSQEAGIDRFHALLSLKRRDILEFVDLPSSNSIVRQIRRLGLRRMTPWELDDIVEVLSREEAVQLLRHHPDIHLNHLSFLKRYRGFLWPGALHLINDHSDSGHITWVCRLVRDVERLSGGDYGRLAQVRSRQALQDLHDRLVDRFNVEDGVHSEASRQARAEELEQEHGAFPLPPVAASAVVQALTSWRSLLDEGRTMHHCVSVYDCAVADGEAFIYQMHDPERLTISVEKRGEDWVLGEVRGYCNVNPSPHALELIHRWFKSGS